MQTNQQTPGEEQPQIQGLLPLLLVVYIVYILMYYSTNSKSHAGSLFAGLHTQSTP